MGGRRLGPRGPGPVIRQMPGTLEADELEPTLKPLKPKVFDVQTPQQATRALDEIRKALLTSE
jgi:hypothetical protein